MFCAKSTTGSNQTVAGLKRIIDSIKYRKYAKFKSDRCGIETQVTLKRYCLFYEFKSDRCGIETEEMEELMSSYHRVQIRPLRD